MKYQENNPNFQLAAPLGFLYNQEENLSRLQWFCKVEMLQDLERAVKICHKYLNLLNLIEKKDFLAFMTEMINLTGFHIFEKEFYEKNPEYAVAEVINAIFNAHKDDKFFNMIFQYFVKNKSFNCITPYTGLKTQQGAEIFANSLVYMGGMNKNYYGCYAITMDKDGKFYAETDRDKSGYDDNLDYIAESDEFSHHIKKPLEGLVANHSDVFPSYNHDTEYVKDFKQRQEKELNIREEQLKLIEYEITKAEKENKIRYMNEVCKKGIDILREYLFIKSGIIVGWIEIDSYHSTHSIKVRTKEHIFEFESETDDYKSLFYQIKGLENERG